MSKKRIRRSELSTPASNWHMVEKAMGTDADLVFLDLEDSVAPREKPTARRLAVEALTTLDWGAKTRAVRINALDTGFAYQDILEVVQGAGSVLDVLIVPKVRSAEDVRWVDVFLTQMERNASDGEKHAIGLEVLIEEVEGLVNVEEIARGSSRLEALIFGPGDFSASQGVGGGNTGMPAYHGDLWYYARSKIVVAARAAGIDAVDGPFADVKDTDGYRLEAQQSAGLGFIGKWAIHPAQIGIANEVYSPSAGAVARARKLLEAYEEASDAGQGAIAVDGVLIDAASARLFRDTVRKAELSGSHGHSTET